MLDPDPTLIYPVRAPRTHHSCHRGNFTDPHFSFALHDHSFHPFSCIHSFIHSSIHPYIHPIYSSIAYAIAASQRFTSRSDSRLIRYERRPIKVQRPAREGLEATSRHIELREKNQDEPQWPCLTPLRSGQGHLNLSHWILTLSQAHRIPIEGRPAGHLSRSPKQHMHLSRGGLRRSGMPHEGYADL